jgi:hypothetical protein
MVVLVFAVAMFVLMRTSSWSSVPATRPSCAVVGFRV